MPEPIYPSYSIPTNRATNQHFAGLYLGMRNIVVTGGDIQSEDYLAGSTGWKINGNGDVEFNDGVFRGAIAASTIDIGGADTTSFHVDAAGNMWLGASTLAAAPFQVSAAGAMTAVSGEFSGKVAAGGSIQSTTYIAGSAGWSINAAGDVEFNNATLRGTLITGTGNRRIEIRTSDLDQVKFYNSSGFLQASLGLFGTTQFTIRSDVVDFVDAANMGPGSITCNNISAADAISGWSLSVASATVSGTLNVNGGLTTSDAGVLNINQSTVFSGYVRTSSYVQTDTLNSYTGGNITANNHLRCAAGLTSVGANGLVVGNGGMQYGGLNVTIGPADSAGVGRRALSVPN